MISYFFLILEFSFVWIFLSLSILAFHLNVYFFSISVVLPRLLHTFSIPSCSIFFQQTSVNHREAIINQRTQ